MNCRLQRLALLFAIVAVWPLVTSSQSTNSASTQSLTLAQYIAELDHCSAVLNRSPVDSAAVRELRATLPASWECDHRRRALRYRRRSGFPAG